MDASFAFSHGAVTRVNGNGVRAFVPAEESN